MTLKDTKTFIPEIPKEWEDRIRSGHTNIWNYRSTDKNKPETKLEPPTQGLYAERFEDGWYWVCGCHKCLGSDEPYSYIVCHEHNRCITCNTHYQDLTETPWGTPSGFQCKPCERAERADRKEKTLARARMEGHSESDCIDTFEILCPTCGSESNDYDHEGEHRYETTCGVCDAPFTVEVNHRPYYTTTLIREEDETSC